MVTTRGPLRHAVPRPRALHDPIWLRGRCCSSVQRKIERLLARYLSQSQNSVAIDISCSYYPYRKAPTCCGAASSLLPARGPAGVVLSDSLVLSSCVGVDPYYLRGSRVTENHPQAPWRTCQADSGCSGSALPPFDRCLGHLHGHKLKQAIKRAKTKGLDARGVTVTPSLLDELIALLDQTAGGAAIVPRARFDAAKFTGPAGFDEATFSGHATFDGAKFHEEARFSGATFSGDARFVGATFIGNAGFDRVAFKGNAGFDWATFRGDAGFDEATFSEDARFGRVKVSGQLSLQSVHAEKRLRLALSTDGTGKINLARASLAGPAVVASTPGRARPRLASLAETDTANLTVSGLDLSDCEFLGAINLERLRIDGPLHLRQAPGRWRARRLVLGEEWELRRWRGWKPGRPLRGIGG